MLLLKVAQDFPSDLLSQPPHTARVGVNANKSKHSRYSNQALFFAYISGAKVIRNHQLVYEDKLSAKYSEGNSIEEHSLNPDTYLDSCERWIFLFPT